MKLISLAVGATMTLSGAGAAATLDEFESAGNFSGDWKNPTVIASGYQTISGTWKSPNDHDLLAFTNLKTGAQNISVKFSPLEPIGDRDWSFQAGGEIFYQFLPWRYSAWEGSLLGKVNIGHANRDGEFSYTLNLGEDFKGALYLGLYGTHGSLAYNISAPGNALSEPDVTAPAPVPLPASFVLLGAAMGALGLFRGRKPSAA